MNTLSPKLKKIEVDKDKFDATGCIPLLRASTLPG